MHTKRYGLLAGIFLLILLQVTNVTAQLSGSGQVKRIDEIQITGNKRIEDATVKSFLGIVEGNEVTPRKVDSALASVYASGLFADVEIEVEGNTLVVEVVENPIISEIAFEGNKRISDEDLAAEIQLSPRSVYTKATLQSDVKRILDVYQNSGRFSAEVTPKVIQLAQNRVNLVFEVDEGDRSDISRISFVGNTAFSESRLRSVINTKETVWYRFLSSNDLYDPDRLAFDQELLRRFYVSQGYADFKVISAAAELSPDKESFQITFTLDEGEYFTFGAMDVNSELPGAANVGLDGQILTMQGEEYNAGLIEDTVDQLTQHLGDLGYAFVDIAPKPARDEEENIIALTYHIKEGPRVYVENIEIKGNTRTLDEVIRREFRLVEGDPYNASKLRRSKQRIENLGFFRSVNFKNVPGSSDDKVNIIVEVEEQSTGELTFGAGFSTADGALGDISIVERNLLGKGQFMRLNLTLAAVRQEIDFAFTEPHFLDRELQAGFDIFSIQRNNDAAVSNLTFDSELLGGALRTGYSLSEHIQHTIRYSLRDVNITDIDQNASRFIRDQEGSYITSLIGHSIVWDTRDNRFQPTEGHILRINQDIAGLGGDAKFVRHEIRSAYYEPIYGDDWVLKIATMGGHIMGFGDEDVRINDRFFIGGDELRGFANQGLGPRDAASRDPLGGNIYAVGTVEVTFPLGLPEEFGLSGALFTDIGTIFENDDNETAQDQILDEFGPRASVGFGLGWVSPFGPVRVDIALPYLEEDFDEREVIRFNFGTRF